MTLAAASKDWFGTDLETILYISASALAMYAIIIGLVRINGLRSFSQMSAFDFASTVAVGTILATTALSDQTSIPEGTIAIAVLFAAQFVISTLRRKINFGDVVDNSPMVIMRDGEVLEDRLAETNITRADLMTKIRQRNVCSPSDVKLAVLETTGEVNVLTAEEGEEVDEALLEGVVQ